MPRSGRRPLRWGLAAVGLAVAVALVAGVRVGRVTSTEMGPGFRPGDVVVLLPSEPVPGDVVRLRDPASGRFVLRRVLADGGRTITLGAPGVRVDRERVVQREMRRVEEQVVLSEVDRWLVRVPAARPGVVRPPVEVPTDHLYLLADDRGQGVDSRWWGPVPAGAVSGVVWLRLGPADAWRGLVGVRGADGPWRPGGDG